MRGEDLTKLIKSLNERLIPLRAHIDLTYRCNLKCIHCYQDSPAENELSTDELLNIIDQLAQEGCLEISFTGGEPLIRGDFTKIAEYAREKGHAITVQTNGTLIDEKMAIKLKELNADAYVSLYGVTARTHERITLIPGSFSKTMQGIKLLKRAGVKVHVSTVVMRQNVMEVKDLSKMCREMDIEFEPSPLLLPTVSGSLNPLKYKLTDEELEGFVDQLIEEGGWESSNEGRVGLCTGGRSSLWITADGRVYPCFLFAHPIEGMGDVNLRRTHLHEAWRVSPTFNSIREVKVEDFGGCLSCLYKSVCAFCPALVLIKSPDKMAALHQVCRLAKATYQLLQGRKQGEGKNKP
ncbi:MAG: radical SAM protein [Thermoproteota archaeon]